MNALEFFEAIYHAAGENQYTYIWSRDNENKSKRTNSFKIEEIETMLRVSKRLNVESYRNVSFSMGLLDKPLGTYNRAKSNEIVGIPCLWCDIDISNPVHGQSQKLAGDIETAKSFLPSELPASIIVNSGYGIHGYWIFDKLFEFKSDSDRKHAHNLLEKLQGIIRLNAGGCYIYKTADLSRMLRIPGTYNWKGGNKNNAPICHVIEASGEVYKIDEIESILDTALKGCETHSENPREISTSQKDYLEKMRSSNNTPTSETLQELSQKLIDHCAFCKHCADNSQNLTHDEFKYFFPILLRAADGESLAIEICRQRFAEKFDIEKTRLQIESFRKMTPINCSTISTIFPNCPENCPVKRVGKKSPIAFLNSKIVRKVANCAKIGEIFEECPELIRELIIPEGFELNESHILDLRGKTPRKIINTPVVISREISSNETELPDFYELMYQYRGKWLTCRAKPTELCDSRKLVEQLSANGILVTTRQGGSAAEYFASFLELNVKSIKRVKGYRKLGWHGNKFIIPTITNENCIIYETFSSKQIQKKGKRAIQIELFREISKYPDARILVDANLAAPLLEKLNCRNFIIDIVCKSQRGKTSALLFANSLWGTQKWMCSFNSTINASESFAIERNSLPTNINEWQLTNKRDREQIADQLIHRFGEGIGRARNTREGKLKEYQEYRGIAIVTSEEQITSDNAVQGIKTRCLEIESTNVMGYTLESGEEFVDYDLCDRIQELTQLHYGYLGAEFIENILKAYADDPEFKRMRQMKQKVFDLIMKARNRKINKSHADFLSVIAVANYHANRYFLKMAHNDAIEEMIKMVSSFSMRLAEETSMTDAERAKNAIIDTYEQLRQHFLPPAVTYTKMTENPFNEKLVQFPLKDPIMGFWTSDYVLYWNPQSLKATLKSLGFSDRKILKEWNELGWLDLSKGDHRALVKAADGARYRGYGLSFIEYNSAPSNEY